MKKAFPPGSDARKLLLEGFVAFRLDGEPAASGSDSEALIEMEGFLSVYYHVGLMYVRPFRPTLMLLEEAHCPSEAPTEDGRRYVKVLRFD